MASTNQIVGRYKIYRVLGRGGLGTVYLAEDVALGRQVALKTLPFERSEPRKDADYTEKRFQREAYSGARLSHPGIVTVFDVGTTDDVAYIAMEYVPGESLATLLARSAPLRTDVANRILEQIASALDYIHSKGIVHRDIKPSNVLIDLQGNVKIADFGIARIRHSKKTTQHGMVIGTLSFMAPEQFRGGGRVDAASDRFSFGVVAYEMLTARLPFEGDVPAIMQKIMNDRPVSVSALNPKLPICMDAIFEKALAKSAENRYATCKAFVGDLKLCAASGRSKDSSFPKATGATDRSPAKNPPTQEGSGKPPPPAPTTSNAPMDDPEGDRNSSGPSTMIGRLRELEVPSGFLAAKTGFFEADKVRFDKIEESIKFFRNNLNKEYETLSKQADLTYKLWVGFVLLGFVLIAVGAVLIFTVGFAQGTVAALCGMLIYFIQRVFYQREDHYRQQANEKSQHLQYGNQWLLVIQSIDSIEDPQERTRRQSRLVDVLTDKLMHRSQAASNSQSSVQTG